MGAIPNKLPGFQDIEPTHEARARFEAAWGATIPPQLRLAPDEMFDGDGARRAAHALRDRREPGAVRGRHQTTTRELLARARLPGRAGHLPDQDRRAGRRRASRRRASWCEAEGTVTNSERRVQRVRKALDPPGEARDDIWIIAELARAARATTGASRRPRRSGTSCARSRPMHARHELRAARGARRHPVAVPRRGRTPARRSCTRGCGSEPLEGPPAPFSRRRARAAGRGARRRVPAPAHDRPPARVVQHRRADRPLPLAAAPRRVARPLARGRRARSASRTARSCACPRAAARSRRRCASTRRCGPASPS